MRVVLFATAIALAGCAGKSSETKTASDGPSGPTKTWDPLPPLPPPAAPPSGTGATGGAPAPGAKADAPVGATPPVATEQAAATVGKVDLATNPYHVVLPNEFAVASVTEVSTVQIAAVGTLGAANFALLGPPAAFPTDRGAKIALIDKVITATTKAECLAAIPSKQDFSDAHTKCFGPPIRVTKAPDSGMDVSIGSGEIGIWWDYAEPAAVSGEACAAAKVNAIMNEMGRYFDTPFGLEAMVVCALGIDGVALPDVGATVDATANLDGLDLASLGLTVAAAKVERKPDDAGHPVYETTITGAIASAVAPTITTPVTFAVAVSNTPENAANDAYHGYVTYVLQGFPNLGTPVAQAASIRFESDGERQRYAFRRAQFPIDATTTLDEAKAVAITGWNAAYSEAIVDIDGDGYGKLSYATLTTPSAAARVFNVETEKVHTGTAYFGLAATGAALDSQAALHSIVGMECAAGTPVDRLQKQILALDETSKKWLVASSLTTYAPTKSCSWNTLNDPQHLAVFHAGNNGPGDVQEDAKYPREQNLFSVAEYRAEWSAPEAP